MFKMLPGMEILEMFSVRERFLARETTLTSSQMSEHDAGNIRRKFHCSGSGP